MAGLINSAMEQGQPQGGAVQDEQQAMEQEQALGQEEQGLEEESGPEDAGQLSQLMEAFSLSIHSEGQAEAVVEGLSVDAPEDAIAMITIQILRELDSQSGNKIPSDLLIQAAIEGMELIAELGVTAGLFEFDDAMRARTTQSLVRQAIEDGIIDPQEIQELIESMPEEEVQSMVQEQQQIAGGV